MSSLVALVAADGPIRAGTTPGANVLALQVALSQAGYRVAADSDFGPRTQQVVQQFQLQHGLKADGVVGAQTAAALDAPHAELVASATPLLPALVKQALQPTSWWPHDDTASLLAFYGKPWEDSSLLTHVEPPFAMFYEGGQIFRIQFHVKGATALLNTLNACRDLALVTPDVLIRIRNYSGSYNYRPIRGSSRLSCHAFGAAIDFDAEHLPLGQGVAASAMPESVVQAFKAQGFFWGGDYTGRKDPMHFQLAHE